MGWLSSRFKLKVLLFVHSTALFPLWLLKKHLGLPTSQQMEDNHTPTKGCRLCSVWPNITITLRMVSARTLLCFRWMCNAESKAFHGHGQGNLCPVLHYHLWIHREVFIVGWPLIEHRGVIIQYLCGLQRQNNISIDLHNSIKEHMRGFPYYSQFSIYHKCFHCFRPFSKASH